MRTAIVLVVALLSVPLASAALLGAGQPQPAAVAPAAVVTVRDFEFVDAASGGSDTHVRVGDAVEWRWALYQSPHSVAQGNPFVPDLLPREFESGVHTMDYNETTKQYVMHTFRHTFDEPGVYFYACEIHPNMQGTVFVLV